MANPFEKRASEYLRDHHAFLSLVGHEPLLTWFAPRHREGRLYDRLVQVVGTPGSGKTTIASIMEYSRVAFLAPESRQGDSDFKNLIDALTQCGVFDNNRPVVAGVRLPMEGGGYRNFQELPYEGAIKHELVWKLIQARAVLGWIRNILKEDTITLEQIGFRLKPGTWGAEEAMGGTVGPKVQKMAREVEQSIYRIGSSLLPVPLDDFPPAATNPYQPLDIIESISTEGASPRKLRPLLILDDVHTLHPDQFNYLTNALRKREMPIARWMLMRLDALSPTQSLLDDGKNEETPGNQPLREIVRIHLQTRTKEEADTFRKMALPMAGRYLKLMEVFARRGSKFEGLLSEQGDQLSNSKMKDLRDKVDSVQKELSITDDRRHDFAISVDAYCRGSKSKDLDEGVRLAMVRILMHRYANRVRQRSLFEKDDPEPSRPLQVDSSLAHAARLQLHHEFDRTLFFGVDCLVNASSENPELFLKLAAPLVSRVEACLIGGKKAELDAATQQKLLRDRANAILRSEWNFPYHEKVRNLTTNIAHACKNSSLKGNARNGAGDNAVAIPQWEFETLPQQRPELARVLHYAVGYNALLMIPGYNQGNTQWCLFQLGGILILAHGLTWLRGGFLERTAYTLESMMAEGTATP